MAGYLALNQAMRVRLPPSQPTNTRRRCLIGKAPDWKSDGWGDPSAWEFESPRLRHTEDELAMG